MSAAFSRWSNQRRWLPVRSLAAPLAAAPNSRSGTLPVPFAWVRGPMITRRLWASRGQRGSRSCRPTHDRPVDTDRPWKVPGGLGGGLR
jgi:hypothetical protein